MLNTLVLNSLHQKNIPAVSIAPHLIMRLNNHSLADMNYDIFKECLNKDFIPVTFGDVVFDEKLGFSICSGDLLIKVLTEYFKPEKVVFVMDEDGIYTSNPKVDKNAEFIDEISTKDFHSLTASMDNHADVTGGMRGKLQTIQKTVSYTHLRAHET